MGILKTLKKAVKKVLSGVTDNSPKVVTPVPDAQLGPQGAATAAARKTAAPRPRRGSRGRDSTIITAGSSIGSRTLLG